ncbi:cell wall-associated protease [Pedobacter sp. CG_S7]|uniref:S8 family serine peptidase n=1 Tax=Pedobacter sp. CG_S7 TaxID=3143930 RepID=UPI0033946857
MNLRIVFIIFFISINLSVFAQKKDVILPPNWYNLDLAKDGYFGISTEKAYTQLLKNRTPKTKVVVAVIDGGVETTHEDLKGLIWVNQKEIPGNDIDDDQNGYIDDVHGWNFIGSKKGNLAYDNLELVRIYRKYNPKYKSTIKSTKLDSIGEEQYALYNKVTTEFGKKYDDADQNFRVLNAINKVLDSVALVNKKVIPSFSDIENYKADNEMEERVKKIIRSGSKESGSFNAFYKEIKDAYKQYDVMLRYNLNPAYDQRKELVGDDYDNSKERFYGNNDVKGPNAEHGTHVSGIIAANRNNSLGIIGIAANVSIMAIRVVPDGDERDKDVANGIRYAVDNGARIINMSFGKEFKWDKPIVDAAVKYAEAKNVLLVHAAGNDNQNVDRVDNYPNKYYDGSETRAYQKKQKLLLKVNELKEKPKSAVQRHYKVNATRRSNKKIELDTAKFNLPHARNWIETGASSYSNDANLKTSFSNYGKYNVDVFAPGLKINSTVPDSHYEVLDGTSMAAPVVSGLAAVILSYYPNLKAEELREIIIKSAVKVSQKVKLKDDMGSTIKVPFSNLCGSAGIVNLFNALKLAEKY